MRRFKSREDAKKVLDLQSGRGGILGPISFSGASNVMQVKVVVRRAAGGGFEARCPALGDRAALGESPDEAVQFLVASLREAFRDDRDRDDKLRGEPVEPIADYWEDVAEEEATSVARGVTPGTI